MLESITAVIAFGAFGLLTGAFVPAAVGYVILFLRKHGLRLKTFLRLGGRLVVAFLVLMLMPVAIWATFTLLGTSSEIMTSERGENIFVTSIVVGGQIGFWGVVVGLIVGIRKARKSARATER